MSSVGARHNNRTESPQRVLLLSGLSLKSMNSFSTQLSLLARGFESLGVATRLAGVSPHAGSRARLSRSNAADLPAHTNESLQPLLAAWKPDAVITLGYLDQFPFLKEISQSSDVKMAPTYLWAQFSRRVDSIPPRVTVVPLTPQSGSYARGAGSVVRPIPHGVDTSVFAPASPAQRKSRRERHRLPSESFIIGYVATNQTRKRINRLIESFRIANSRRPDTCLCVKTDREVFHGGYDIPRLISQHHLEQSVRLITAEMEETELAGLLSCFDLYLHVSEWEGFGIPACEALACGVPLATPNGQGPGEFTPFDEYLIDATEIADGSGTRLLEVDPDDAARVCLEAMSLPDEIRHRNALRARVKAVEYCSIESVAAEWLELIGRQQNENDA